MKCKTCEKNKEDVVKVYKTRDEIILSNDFICTDCFKIEKAKVKTGGRKISGGGKSGLYKVV